MGRRKIEIKPIRDDRNRSVTFLKRKGGLFKKAHELSVLCSVDVAVIIFGHNKKLYEYSSGDINETIGRFQYYGGAHEHKGPADFKNGGDDDDEDEDGGDEVPDERGTSDQRALMQPGMQNHPGFQHVRHGTPVQSPPMPNGSIPQFQRGPSPLPGSRPASRMSQHGGAPTHARRASSNLVPQQHQPNMQGPPPPGTCAWQPNQPYYAAPPGQMQRPPGQGTYPPPNYSHQMQHQNVQQAVMQDQRRASVPPTFPHGTPPQQHVQRMPSQEHLLPPPQHRPHMSPQPGMQRATPSPQPPQQEFTSPPIPQPKPLPAHAKAQSIFTPIDDSRSLLAQHWGSTGAESDLRVEAAGRSASVDVAAMQRDKDKAKANGTSPRPGKRKTPQPPKGAPTRSATAQSDAKRPRLKVQIPSEHSGDEGGTANSEAPSTSNPSAANGSTQAGPSHGVVLPPPSPSANALLSAGAQGPPNPFARPPPPMTTNPHAANRDANHIETPMSALPSRFMSDNLLPSPSTFYPEWMFGRGSDMLPSPLTFQTPVAPNGSTWKEEDRKRAAEEEAAGGAGKRAKS